MSLFCCPLCAGALRQEGGALRCGAGHSFDIAREGYVNLLPVQAKHSLAPGDDKTMSAARRAFLDKGWYAPLREALCALAVELTSSSPTVLDAGCGEGYYTSGIRQALEQAGKMPQVAGTDISKFILRSAARRDKTVAFAVASSYHLPLASESVELLLDCFSPLAAEEFARVLRPGGVFLYVVPAADHLWEMKQVLYDRPYRNEEKETQYAGFTHERTVPVETVMDLPGEDLKALFEMTPYAWKTPRAGRERLLGLEGLQVRAAFRILVYRREGRREDGAKV